MTDRQIARGLPYLCGNSDVGASGRPPVHIGRGHREMDSLLSSAFYRDSTSIRAGS